MGYHLIGGFCRQNHRKGGVAIFAKTDLQNEITLVSTSNPASECICETTLIKVKLKKKVLYILGVYRPPNSNLDQAIEVLMTEMDNAFTTKSLIVIMGDINIDTMTTNKDAQMLEEALLGYDVRRLKLPPTRITHSTQTSIDFVCTNVENTDIGTTVLDTGISDHRAQVCDINFVKNLPPTKTLKRKINKQTLENLRLLLKAKDWNKILQLSDADYAFSQFHKTLQQAIDISCPLSVMQLKQNNLKKPWDTESHTLKNNYLKALNQATLTGQPEDKREAAQKKKAYDIKLKEMKKKQTANRIEEADNKTKALWAIINQERKSHNSNPQPQLITIDTETVSSPIGLANHLNEFFATIAERTLLNNGHRNPHSTAIRQDGPRSNLHFYKANCDEIRKIIDGLKKKSSAGEDDYSSKLVKYCKNEILTPLTSLVNKSLAQGIFPSCLKTAKVYPKYKKGNINEPSSYRPISLLSTFSKILERVILTRLLNHLNQNELLSPRQHGFKKNKSTTTAIVQLVECLIDKLDEGCVATSILLDYSKAFDCLGHDLIIQKLLSLGVNGNEANWFRSYLSNRTQLTELTSTNNGTLCKVKSELTQVTRGVPQGSVLGPVLFTLLTNDFPQHLEEHCTVVMYADDTALIIADKDKIQLDVNSYIAFDTAKQYCHANDLVLNENKTQQLIFTPLQNHLNGLPEVDVTTSTKYLGLILDNKLSWVPHVDNLCRKLSSCLYVVRRIKQISNMNVAKTAYHSIFESHLRYGLILWGGNTASNLHKVLIIQKRTIRALCGLKPRDSCRDSFKEQRILTVTALFILESILHVVTTGQTRVGDYHYYNTRNRHNFALETHHLSLYKKKPSYRGAVYFNNLPDHLKTTPTKQLKNSLKSWFLQRPFYTIQEYMNWKTHAL